VVIFYPFSRSPGTDSGGLEKRDSTADFCALDGRIFGRRHSEKWQAAADLLEKGAGSL
jgi:hypothetical protein